MLASSNLHNTFTMCYVSYSPELDFHYVNYFSCIPDCKDQQPGATSAAASVWLCGQPAAMMLRGKYHGPPLLPGGSQKSSFRESRPVLPNSCFFPPRCLWISKGDLTPTNLSRLVRECPARCEHPSPCTVLTGEFGCKFSICNIAQMSFLNEDPQKRRI